MPQGEPVANWGSIIHDVERKFIQPDHGCKLVDHIGEVLERVLEALVIRHAALAEPGIIGRDQMELIRETRNQIPEHVRRGWEAVQEQDGGSIRIARFAIENVQLPDTRRCVMNGLVSAAICIRYNHDVYSP